MTMYASAILFFKSLCLSFWFAAECSAGPLVRPPEHLKAIMWMAAVYLIAGITMSEVAGA